jgi:hypothetical protein
VDFIAEVDGIRLRKVVVRGKQAGVLGCLKKELAGHSVNELMDELRGHRAPAGRLKPSPVVIKLAS